MNFYAKNKDKIILYNYIPNRTKIYEFRKRNNPIIATTMSEWYWDLPINWNMEDIIDCIYGDCIPHNDKKDDKKFLERFLIYSPEYYFIKSNMYIRDFLNRKYLGEAIVILDDFDSHDELGTIKRNVIIVNHNIVLLDRIERGDIFLERRDVFSEPYYEPEDILTPGKIGGANFDELLECFEFDISNPVAEFSINEINQVYSDDLEKSKLSLLHPALANYTPKKAECGAKILERVSK